MSFPTFIQPDSTTCGVTSLKIICMYYGFNYTIENILKFCPTSIDGTSLYNLSKAAESLGFTSLGAKASYDQLRRGNSFPFIVHLKNKHYVVVYKITNNKVYVSDPGIGLAIYKKEEFVQFWEIEKENAGIVLLLEPKPGFSSRASNLSKKKIDSTRKGIGILFTYVNDNKGLFCQFILGMLVATLIQLAFPFLTQSIVDIGIQNNNLSFIYLVLFAQLALFFSRTIIELMRVWTLMYLSTKISLSLTKGFFIKLMNLPINTFHYRAPGEMFQRIYDNQRIEQFLTGSSIRVLFSFLNILIYGVVLFIYNFHVFMVFSIGSLIYLIWILLFLKQKALIDEELFISNSKNNNKIIEMISGMREIKQHNAERKKRWEWEILQFSLFKTNIKSLSFNQIQSFGANFINEIKNVLIAFLSAKLVISGEITLGMMLSISFISGQLNGPILDISSFIQQLQNAKLSLSRLQEIHNRKDEESDDLIQSEALSQLPISIKNLSFNYGEIEILKKLNFTIPEGKITAIVGKSGSGKTTLLNLLLKALDPTKGMIFIGSNPLSNISHYYWREKCGVVMQDGYIFSDTLANNITFGKEEIDLQLLKFAIDASNLTELIKERPEGHNFKIDLAGRGLSAGEKQRILIARAIYKKPEYLFLDESTSSLDTENEKVIMNNLRTIFHDKTIVIIAHRLSTIRDADQILFLDKGEIVEYGTHTNLVSKRGEYFKLVKNQLEFENDVY